MAEDLGALRARIDDVDAQVLELLCARIQLVLQVGDYKRVNGVPVHDPRRERDVLERLVRLARPPLSAAAAQRVFERIIEECRRIEQEHVTES